MNALKYPKSARRTRKGGRDERGVALITTLLLLLLMTGMTVAMVLSVNSDMLINGYYRNFRGSFYAADSGLAVARLDLYNQIIAGVNTNVAVGTAPIANTATLASNVSSYLTTHYGSYTKINGAGQANGSWPAKFKITGVTMGAVTCVPQGVGVGSACPVPSGTGTLTGYKYTFPYTVIAVGASGGSEQTTISDTGSVIVNVNLSANTSVKTSFAAWGMFIDTYDLCSGGYLVPGTISGPVFTNGGWTFGDTGNYTFTDSVGSANSKAGFQYSNGTCNQTASSTNKYGSTTIAPSFQSGFNLGSNSIPLPTNDYNQKRAVLDGQGDAGTNPSNSEMNSVLRNASKTKYPTGGASSGVYLPYSVDSSGNATFTGGGIYVQGNASVTLAASGSSSQVYTIVQGSTTTTITVNSATNTTTMVSGSSNVTISGVPMQYDTNTGAPIQDATMLFVNGDITALKGVVQDSTLLTVTGGGDITVTGDIKYKTPPINIPADTINTANNNGQALGIFTANGDVQLANGQSSGNLEIDAAVATLASGGSGGIINTGANINTLTIVGGRIQNQIKNIGATTRNVYFDRRFAQNNFAPPWFPSTTVSVTPTNYTGSVSPPVYQRLTWQNQSSYN